MATKALSKPNLYDLDNNVLLKLFERFSLDDLCTMKGICTRFRMLAIKSFKQNHANNMVFDNPIENMVQTTRIIKCFGQRITSITIEGSVAWDLNLSTLQLIAQHCGCKLVKLRLICFNFDKQAVAVLKTMSSKLQTIELHYCTIESKQHAVNYNVAFKAMDNLKEFVIIGGTEEIDLKFLNKRWPALDKVEVIAVQLTDESVLCQVLKKNREIKYFSYLPNTPSECKHSWMNSFDNYAPHLVDLSIELVQNIDYAQLLKGLTTLQRIVISCEGYNKPIHPLITILSKMKTLEVFSLWNADFCQFLTMPKLKNVHTLELRELKSVFGITALVHEIAMQWINVETLYLDHSIIRAVEQLGHFVQNIPQLRNLYLCDMKSFFLMPNKMLFDLWCSKRFIQLHIFVDSRYLARQSTHPENPIVFHAIKDRVSQSVNVVCGRTLN